MASRVALTHPGWLCPAQGAVETLGPGLWEDRAGGSPAWQRPEVLPAAWCPCPRATQVAGGGSR